jgi:hypothetical protein
MSKEVAKKEDKPPEFERAAEAIWNAEFLLVVVGPLFEETRLFTSSDYCDPSTVSNPNKFMGYWGGLFNEFNEKTPHEGFHVLRGWRDRFFCPEDIRKRGPKKQNTEETEVDRIPRFQAYTRNISGFLQKAGIPDGEVYETCGTVFQWQCSRVPPCCNKLTPVDRAFRFEINEDNQEAQPIKYVNDRREDKPKERFTVTDRDEEELRMVGTAMDSLLEQKPTGMRGDPSTALRKVKLLVEKALPVKLLPSLQIGYERFPDLFVGFPTTNKEKPGPPVTFVNAPKDPKALITSLPGGLGEAEKKEIPPHLRTPEVPIPPPLRCSHLLAHVNVLDKGMYKDRCAPFYVTEPERWQAERMAAYQQVMKVFRTDSHHIAVQRAKRITYNISVAITVPSEYCIQAAGGKGPAEAPGGFRSTVLPPALSSKLLAVKAPDEKTKAELAKWQSDWEQGQHGLFYFSHVLSRETHQEPVHHLYHDQIFIPFPLQPAAQSNPPSPSRSGVASSPQADSLHVDGDRSNGSSFLGGAPPPAAPPPQVPALHLPPKCRFSVVCETVVFDNPDAPQPKPAGAAPPPKKKDEAAATETSTVDCTKNVWQLCGILTAPTPTELADESQFKKNPPPDTVFEYILEDRHRHVVKIGCLRSDPTAVKYIEIESPCDEDVDPTPNIVTTCVRKQDAAPDTRNSESFAAFLQTVRGGGRGGGEKDGASDGRSPMPTPNHILCVNCHDVARPYVQMSKPGIKDEGFCSAILAQRAKLYKAWEKGMMDALKQDQNCSVVLLELGADKKMEPLRAYAEKTFKQLKSSKCTMIRISPHNLEQKKAGSGGGGADAQNLIGLQTPVIQGLTAIERLLVEKMRKIQRGN